MFFRQRRLLGPAVLLGVLLTAGVATAALVPEIRDDGSFFSPEAVRKANAQIKEIKDRYKHDLLIETFKSIPADRVERFNQLDKEGRNRFYEEWAVSRAKAAEVNGIYILICSDPPHLQVEVGNETRRRAFTIEDRNKLASLLLDRLKKKENDQGLLDAVSFVQRTLQHNMGKASAEVGGNGRGAVDVHRGAQSNWGGLLCVGLVALLGIWLVVAVIRMISGGSRGGYGGGQGYMGGAPGYGGGGGGGFMTGLLGGMFGAAAGSWMYDRFFRGDSGMGGGWGSSSAYGAGPGTGSDQPQDTDYSGTGGDFGDTGGGDTGGGGDFGGGGDLGGGDFGGGDFGGGGGGDF